MPYLRNRRKRNSSIVDTSDTDNERRNSSINKDENFEELLKVRGKEETSSKKIYDQINIWLDNDFSILRNYISWTFIYRSYNNINAMFII